MLERMRIGEIVSVHGVKGALKVLPLTDNPIRFCSLTEVDVVPKRAGRKGSEVTSYKVLSATPAGNVVLLKLCGVDDRDKAEKFRGMFLEVPREKAVKLPENSYFVGDLVGCTVKTQDGEVLGTLTEIQFTGANDIYEVTPKDSDSKKSMWLPAIGDVIKNVDIENAEITVELIPGLREVYESNTQEIEGED